MDQTTAGAAELRARLRELRQAQLLALRRLETLGSRNVNFPETSPWQALLEDVNSLAELPHGSQTEPSWEIRGRPSIHPDSDERVLTNECRWLAFMFAAMARAIEEAEPIAVS